LYRSRKGDGTLKIQLDSLKSDNDMLVKALKDTAEYCDIEDDAEIIKAAKTLNQAGTKGFGNIPQPGSSGAAVKKVKKFYQDWIPTEAVAIILAIQEDPNAVQCLHKNDCPCS